VITAHELDLPEQQHTLQQCVGAHPCCPLALLLPDVCTLLLLLLTVVQAWSAGALIAFVLVFNCIPAALELLTFLFVARVSYFSY
jgi:hypothetical protein